MKNYIKPNNKPRSSFHLIPIVELNQDTKEIIWTKSIQNLDSFYKLALHIGLLPKNFLEVKPPKQYTNKNVELSDPYNRFLNFSVIKAVLSDFISLSQLSPERLAELGLNTPEEYHRTLTLWKDQIIFFITENESYLDDTNYLPKNTSLKDYNESIYRSISELKKLNHLIKTVQVSFDVFFNRNYRSEDDILIIFGLKERDKS